MASIFREPDQRTHALRGAPCTTTATAGSSASSAAKKASEYIITKHIPKLTEYIIHIHSTTTVATTLRTFKSCMTILIVSCFFIFIAQNFISSRSFFKLFFSFFIVWVFIWVIFNGHFFIGPFYFIFAGSAFNAKNLVII